MSSGCVRSTLSLDPDVHRVLRFKAALLHGSMCAIVNGAVRAALREDEDDLAVFAEHAAELSVTYEALLAQLKADGTE